MIPQRKKRNSSKVNLTLSAVFHTVLISAIFFLAAREGLVGKKLQTLAVTMVPKEKKPPEPPKEKAPEPKPVQAKPVETAKAAVPPPRAEPPPTAAAPPPAADTAPVGAPAAVSLPSFEFSDGAKEVNTISDPNGIYKALVEHAFLARWNRPDDIADDKFVAQVELTLDKVGKVETYRWLSGSGNKRWDDSVKSVLSQVHAITRPPPKGFPQTFTVRFDVESQKTEDVLHLSSL